MKVRELITRLQEVDPSGDSDVKIYICRRFGGYQRDPTTVRRFLVPGGDVNITDERDEHL